MVIAISVMGFDYGPMKKHELNALKGDLFTTGKEGNETEVAPSNKKKGKVIEHEISYIADFVYQDARTGETIVEDSKGFRTDAYILKRKLMLWVHGIKITEV